MPSQGEVRLRAKMDGKIGRVCFLTYGFTEKCNLKGAFKNTLTIYWISDITYLAPKLVGCILQRDGLVFTQDHWAR
ncbi:hypothetical protein NTGM5_220062 [Candidatus Nitrotoga sp. M5]|nr:hypothetical protein NTGM5_220062 [Candidatus Nitrotoga sp. M5]